MYQQFHCSYIIKVRIALFLVKPIFSNRPSQTEGVKAAPMLHCHIQTCFGAHSASYPIGTQDSFPGKGGSSVVVPLMSFRNMLCFFKVHKHQNLSVLIP
jgi:hypothetical protein